MFFFPCLNLIEYLRYSCVWSCYVNNNGFTGHWVTDYWVTVRLTGCGYSAFSSACRLVTWRAEPYPNYLKPRAPIPGPVLSLWRAAPPAPLLKTERNPVNLSIYLPIYIWARKQVSIQITDSKEGGEGEIIKMLTIVYYLSIYQYRYKISCILFKFLLFKSVT